MIAPILIIATTAFVAYMAMGFPLWDALKLTAAVSAVLVGGWLLFILGAALG